MNLPPDLVAVLAAFAASEVQYLVIFGHAVSLHARPRSTKDLDLWLGGTPDNIERACSALLVFGVPGTLVAELRSARPDEIVWLGRIPARIDFLQTVQGLDFDSAWQRRVTSTTSGGQVSFIGRDDLIANKRAVGRKELFGQQGRDGAFHSKGATGAPVNPPDNPERKKSLGMGWPGLLLLRPFACRVAHRAAL